MNQDVLRSFVQELEKIAVDSDLRAKREKERLLKYMGIGATAGPTINLARNVIVGGKMGQPTTLKSILFSETHPGRWLLGGAFSGAAFSGIIPVLRGLIDRPLRKKYELQQALRDRRRS